MGQNFFSVVVVVHTRFEYSSWRRVINRIAGRKLIFALSVGDSMESQTVPLSGNSNCSKKLWKGWKFEDLGSLYIFEDHILSEMSAQNSPNLPIFGIHSRT